MLWKLSASALTVMMQPNIDYAITPGIRLDLLTVFLPYGLLAFLPIRKHRDNLNMYNIMLKHIAYDQQLTNPAKCNSF